MNSLYLAHRLRVLTEGVRVCSAFAPPAHDAHGFCVRCGGEELPHVARQAAEALDPLDADVQMGAAILAAAGSASALVHVDEIDIINEQCVSVFDGRIVILQPRSAMQPLEALVHAAWLVALAETSASTSFTTVLQRVQGT